ncbi:hypothetical protein JCM3775_001416 [Rhodotorula graminis]
MAPPDPTASRAKRTRAGRAAGVSYAELQNGVGRAASTSGGSGEASDLEREAPPAKKARSRKKGGGGGSGSGASGEKEPQTKKKGKAGGKGKGKGKGGDGDGKEDEVTPARPRQHSSLLRLPQELLHEIFARVRLVCELEFGSISSDPPTPTVADEPPECTAAYTLYALARTSFVLRQFLLSPEAASLWRTARFSYRNVNEEPDHGLYQVKAFVDGSSGAKWATKAGVRPLLDLDNHNMCTLLMGQLARHVFEKDPHPFASANFLLADLKFGGRTSTGDERKKLEDDVVEEIKALRIQICSQINPTAEQNYRKTSPNLFDPATAEHRIDAAPVRPSPLLCPIGNWCTCEASPRGEKTRPVHLRTGQTDVDWVKTGVVSVKIPMHNAVPHLFPKDESGTDPASLFYTPKGLEILTKINDTVIELAIAQGTVIASFGGEIRNITLASKAFSITPVSIAGLWTTLKDEVEPAKVEVYHLRRAGRPNERGTLLVHHFAPSTFSGFGGRLEQIFAQDATSALLHALAPAAAALPPRSYYYERHYRGRASAKDASRDTWIQICKICAAEKERGQILSPDERDAVNALGEFLLQRHLRNNAPDYESMRSRLASGEKARPEWLPLALVESDAQVSKLVMHERAVKTQAANLEAARAEGELYGVDLQAANLEAARAEGELYGVDLRAAKLEAARAEGELYGLDLQAASLEAARAEGELYGVDLQAANLEAARAEGKVVGYDLRAANAQRQRDDIFLALSPSSAPIAKLDGVVDSGVGIATLGGPALRQLCGKVGLSDSCRVAGVRQMASVEQMSGWLDAVRAEVHGRAARGPCADGDEPAQTLVACIKSDELERTRQRAQEAAQQEAPVVRRSGRARTARTHDDDD